MKTNVKIVVAVLSFMGVVVAGFEHSCSHDASNTAIKDNTVNAGKNVASGERGVAGDGAVVNNTTTNQYFYGIDREDISHITTLIPGNEITPKNECDYRPHLPNTLTILLGDSAAITNIFPHTILAMAGEPMLTIDQDKVSGNLIIKNLRIYDEADNRIAQIISDAKPNEIFFNQLYLRQQKTKLSEFSLFDHRDKKILSVGFLNPTTLSVQGVFRNHGGQIVIDENQIVYDKRATTSMSSSCFSYSGVDMNLWVPPN